MNLIVYAEASAGTYPGHMVVGQDSDDGDAAFYGYRFDPADLPQEYRASDRWWNYLATNAVPGQIVDETAYMNHLLQVSKRAYYEKRVLCDELIESQLPVRSEWNPHAWYSFNPDDPHIGHQPCYNCVKWAIMIANRLVVGFLSVIPQGRLMLALDHLSKRRS